MNSFKKRKGCLQFPSSLNSKEKKADPGQLGAINTPWQGEFRILLITLIINEIGGQTHAISVHGMVNAFNA